MFLMFVAMVQAFRGQSHRPAGDGIQIDSACESPPVRCIFPKLDAPPACICRMPVPLKPLNILLVDDEAYFRLFVGKVLSISLDCRVVEAKNGEEAIALSSTSDPDLVLLDINMPRVDGVEALRQIRALKPNTTIVMLTSISEETVVEECVTLGASYFIRKDVRADLLKTELQAMLRLFFPAEQLAYERSKTT